MPDEPTRRKQLTLRYDFEYDVLTVHNIRYAGELFRRLHVAPVGSIFELTAREDGVLTLRSMDAPDRDKLADAIAPVVNAPPITLTIGHPPGS